MKKNLHPQTQKVVFQDITNGQTYLIASTAQTADTIVWSDGNTYPLVKVEISSSSHPAFTGKEAFKPRSSRRETFEKKYARRASLN